MKKVYTIYIWNINQ